MIMLLHHPSGRRHFPLPPHPLLPPLPRHDLLTADPLPETAFSWEESVTSNHAPSPGSGGLLWHTSGLWGGHRGLPPYLSLGQKRPSSSRGLLWDDWLSFRDDLIITPLLPPLDPASFFPLSWCWDHVPVNLHPRVCVLGNLTYNR